MYASLAVNWSTALNVERSEQHIMEKTKQNGQLNWALGKHANAQKVEDTIADGYKSASQNSSSYSRIKARRCAANSVSYVSKAFRKTEAV